MPFPWEENQRMPWDDSPSPSAPTPANNNALPWQSDNPMPWDTPSSQGPSSLPQEKMPWDTTPVQPKEEESFLEKAGYVMDTPRAYLFGLLGGAPGERYSGQQLLFGKDSHEPITSAKGAAGLAAEIGGDPLNFLPGFAGVKALTKAGRAAEKIAPHLDEASKAVKVAREGWGAAEAAGKVIPKHEVFGDLAKIDNAGNLIAKTDRELIEEAAKRQDKVGEAAREILAQESQGRGFNPRLASEAGDRVRQGHEALFSVGGEIEPLPFLKLGELPQATLIEGADAAQGIQDAWRGLGKLPGISHIGDALSKDPKLVEAERDAAGLRAVRQAEMDGLLKDAQADFEAGRYEDANAKLQKYFDYNKAESLPPATGPVTEGFAPKQGNLDIPVETSTASTGKSAIKDLGDQSGKFDQTPKQQYADLQPKVGPPSEPIGDFTPKPRQQSLDIPIQTATADRIQSPVSQAEKDIMAEGRAQGLSAEQIKDKLVGSYQQGQPLREGTLNKKIAEAFGHEPKTHRIDPEMLSGNEALVAGYDQATKLIAQNPDHTGVLIGFDVHNQKGINNLFKDNQHLADTEILGEFAKVLKQEMRTKLPGVDFSFIKNGGDEWSILAVGPKGKLSEEAAREAMREANVKVWDRLKKKGIDFKELENPRAEKPLYDPSGLTGKNLEIYNKAHQKYVAGRGVGFRIGVQEFRAGTPLKDVEDLIAKQHTAIKEKGLDNELREFFEKDQRANGDRRPSGAGPHNVGTQSEAGRGSQGVAGESASGSRQAQRPNPAQAQRIIRSEPKQFVPKDVPQPHIEDFLEPKKGHRVTFSPQSAGIVGRKLDVEGKIIGENTINGKKMFTVKTGEHGERVVPASDVTRVRSQVEAELKNAQRRYERAVNAPEARAAASDAREVLRQVSPTSHEAEITTAASQNRGGGISSKMNTEHAQYRAQVLKKLGLENSTEGQAAALPALIDHAIKNGIHPDQLSKTISEFKSTKAIPPELLRVGDKIKLASDEFEVISKNEKGTKIKDGIELTLPPGVPVPVDKTSKVKPIIGKHLYPDELMERLEESATKLEAEHTGDVPDFLSDLGRDMEAEKKMKDAMGGTDKPGAQPALFPTSAVNKDLIEQIKNAKGGESIGKLGDVFNATSGPGARLRKAFESSLNSDVKMGAGADFAEERFGKGNIAWGYFDPKTKDIVLNPAALKNLSEKEIVQKIAHEARHGRQDAAGRVLPGYNSEYAKQGIEAEARRAENYAGKVYDMHQEEVSRMIQGAGMDAKKATEEAKKLIPPGTSPEAAAEIKRLISESLETGDINIVPEHVRPLVENIRKRLDTIGEFDSRFGGMNKLDDVIEYVPHIATENGKQFFASIDAAKEAQIIDLLNEARKKKGLPEISYLAGGSKQVSTSNVDAKFAKIINDLGLMPEIMSGHSSMLSRKYKGLTISELNDVFKKAGATGEVFNSDPLKALYVRELRHLKTRGAVDFVNGLLEAEKIATSIPAGPMGDAALASAKTVGDGIKEVPGFGYVLEGMSSPKGTPAFKSIEEAKAAKSAFQTFTKPENAEGFLGLYDQITRIWKSWVTRGFPSYHVRNRFSNRIQSNLDGVPLFGEHYKIANRVLAGQDIEVKIGDRIYKRDDILKEALRHNVINNGFFEEQMKEIASASKGDMSPWNPLNPDNSFIKTGEKISATALGTPGRVMSGAKVETLGANAIESTDRLGHYLYKRMDGESAKAAADSVNRALFDYSKKSMTDFEKKYANRAIFFYGYISQVLPFMLHSMQKDSKKVLGFLHLTQQSDENAPIPPYLQQGLTIPLGKDEAGQDMYLNGLGTPMESAAEPIEALLGGPKVAANKVGSLLNPLLRIPIEQATGKDLYLRRDIEDLRKAPNWAADLPQSVQDTLGVRKMTRKNGSVAYEMDPDVLYLLRNNPLSRVSNTASKLSDDDKGTIPTLINLLSGARITSVDADAEKAIRKRDAIIQRLKELEREGKAKSYERFGYSGQTKDPEVIALLRALGNKKEK